MRWVTDKETIVEALQNLISVIEKASITPITTNVKLQLSGNEISLVATDTKLQIKCVIELPSDQNIEESFATTVSAQKLLDSCVSSKSNDIIFNLTDDKLEVSFEGGKFTLLTMPAEQFPEIQDPETSSSIELPQKIWKELLISTEFAVSDRDHRETLRGLLLEIEGSTIRLVGTDGHRLAIAETNVDNALEGELKQVILPKKSVLEMQRIFSESDESLKLSFNGTSHVSFKLRHNLTTFTSNLIEGDYPNYRIAIPQDNKNVLELDAKELLSTLKRAVIIQKASPKTVNLTLQSDRIDVRCSTLEGETSELTMPATYNGEEITMSFNEGYLQGALKALNTEIVKVKIGDSNRSVIIEDNGVVSKSHVIMPLNI